jgi:hypothetical protein
MHNRPYVPNQQDTGTLNNAMIEQWDHIRHNFPYSVSESEKRRSIQGILQGNTDSYINLVTESTMLNNVFVTEKTWRPIASAQLFVILGSKGVVAHLRDIGVDVFDDIVDHEYYDSEPNWQQRIHKAHEVLDTLSKQDLQKIYQHTHNRRLTNVEKFYAGEFDHHGSLRYIIQCINTLN